MNWKRWKLGVAIAFFLALLTAGAGLTDQKTTWRGFVAVFCVAMLSQLGTFLYRHPVEQISFGAGDTQPPFPTTDNQKKP